MWPQCKLREQPKTKQFIDWKENIPDPLGSLNIRIMVVLLIHESKNWIIFGFTGRDLQASKYA